MSYGTSPSCPNPFSPPSMTSVVADFTCTGFASTVPPKIHPDDYAAAVSPALYAILDDTDGALTGPNPSIPLDYTEEAMMGMVAGAAPNLQHVWIDGRRTGRLFALQRGQPPIPLGHRLFFPRVKVDRGLQSLHFIGHTETLPDWAARTDFSKLNNLTICSDMYNPGITANLADMAVRGELASLRDLRLEHSREPGDINSPLYRLLAALKPNSLRILHLKHGPIDEDAFGIILKQQGRSLRELIVFPKWNWLEAYGVHNPPPKPLVGLTPALSAQLADSCHNLEHAFFAVDRTLGDADECSVYRALSRLPRLETLHLELDVTVQRNEHFWEQGIEVYDRPRNIPQAELSRAISNAAVDASLARAIFNIISPHHQGLQRLSIGTSLKNGPYSRATVTSGFFRLLRWFAREWSCEWKCSSSGEPTVEIREGMSNLTEQSGEYWATLDVDIARGDVEGNERDEAPDLAAFVDAFADIWPRTTSRWWEEWRSLPLCPDQTQTEGN